MKTVILAAAVAVSLTALTGLALAEKEHQSLPKTALTIEQAIKAVTDTYPGRVVEAELEAEDGKAEYEITVVSTSGESREYLVDAQSGQISEEKEDGKEDGGREK